MTVDKIKKTVTEEESPRRWTDTVSQVMELVLREPASRKILDAFYQELDKIKK